MKALSDYDIIFNSIAEWNEFKKTIMFTHILICNPDGSNAEWMAEEICKESSKMTAPEKIKSIKRYYVYCK